MHSLSRALFQEEPAGGRLNSLMTRMLSSNNNDSNQSPSNNNIRRNLFGTRLNHDQLKDDLKDLWKEQVERQKLKWNFDFETLKPLADSTNHKSTQDAKPQFKWTKVKTITPLANNNNNNNTDQENLCAKVCPAPPSSTPLKSKLAQKLSSSGSITAVTKKTHVVAEYAQTTLEQRELRIAGQRRRLSSKANFDIFSDFKATPPPPPPAATQDDEEADEEEEEEDEALAVPQFYKQQRRLKLHETHHSLNLNNNNNNSRSLATQTAVASLSKSVAFQPIFKMKKICSSSASTCETPHKITSTTTAINQATASTVLKKETSSASESCCCSTPLYRPKALSPATQNLIITFSENRKDTLRSAAKAKRSSQLLTQTRAPKVLKPTKKKQLQKQRTQLSAFTATVSNAKNSDNMKQQSLLDLFKQRKRRHAHVTETKHAQEDSGSSSSAHFLRSSAALGNA